MKNLKKSLILAFGAVLTSVSLQAGGTIVEEEYEELTPVVPVEESYNYNLPLYVGIGGTASLVKKNALGCKTQLKKQKILDMAES